MVSLITHNEKNYISLHMEEVFNDYTLEFIENEQGKQYMKCKEISLSTIEKLSALILDINEKELCIDFTNMIGVQNNEWKKLLNIIEKQNISISNIEKLENEERQKELFKYCTCRESYLDIFKHYSIKEINEITDKSANYQTQNGVTLTSYINVKKIIEDQKNFFKWCYILSKQIIENDEYKKFENKTCSEQPILLCHTLNGSSIATIVAKLLNVDICFINHLGPYSKLSNHYFDENIQQTKNYIIVVDMICLGNEISRAQDIVEFLGGKTCGYVTFIDLGLSKVVNKSKIKVRESVSLITPEVANTKLQYRILTDLCHKLEGGAVCVASLKE